MADTPIASEGEIGEILEEKVELPSEFDIITEISDPITMHGLIQNKKHVVLLLIASYCGPSKKLIEDLPDLLGEIEKAEQEIYFGIMSIDLLPPAAIRFSVRDTPSYVFFKNGVEHNDLRFSGFNMAKLSECCEDLLRLPDE
ncbi:hypothetical protein ADUPG1_006103 [Aduncisulcus paluster]|uniref:Thioredoxin domain-containing protein n=1 Tax=Aduncisulcus paluster TaxID=2918883 RepID=A0ABQ5KGT4_9EUKA|nr:hypothetical protein ADUPG1_006103 [Aduncisulcus paluster]